MSENFLWVDLLLKDLEIFQANIYREFSGENVRECLGIWGGGISYSLMVDETKYTMEKMGWIMKQSK